jgi:hypothetical protein
MIGFFLKKSFFDGWDNLFTLVFLNLGFVLVIGLGVLLPGALGVPAWLGYSAGFLAIMALSVWWSACVFALRKVADFGTVKLSDMPQALRDGLVPGLQVGIFLIAGWILLSVGLPFYLSKGGMLGALAAGVLFWCAVIVILSIQYYIPLRARLGGGLRKNLRKSLLLFFDNGPFSIFLFFYNVLGLALSLPLAFIMPGPAGAALALDVALRLRLYKYDWLEANPDARRRSPPWAELLAEDRELVGHRTLKGMIFPWKE